MKRFCTFFLTAIICYSLAAQDIDKAWVLKNYSKIERQIPMRDGVKLFTSIYYPKDSSENHPILMERTPYSCAPYGEELQEFLGFLP